MSQTKLSGPPPLNTTVKGLRNSKDYTKIHPSSPAIVISGAKTRVPPTDEKVPNKLEINADALKVSKKTSQTSFVSKRKSLNGSIFRASQNQILNQNLKSSNAPTDQQPGKSSRYQKGLPGIGQIIFEDDTLIGSPFEDGSIDTDNGGGRTGSVTGTGTGAHSGSVVAGSISGSVEVAGGKESKFPIRGYVALNCLMIFWGVVGLLVTKAFQKTRPRAQEFLQISQENMDVPPKILTVGSGASILCGMTALFVMGVCESSVFFPIHPHVHGLLMGLDMLAAAYVFVAWNLPGLHVYQRIMEANMLGTAGGIRRFYRRMEETLECCGLEGPHNWIRSVCSCILVTCCAKSRNATCVQKIKDFENPASPSFHDFSTVQDYLWPRNCLEVIQEELFNLKLSWILFPLTLLFFQTILIVNINNLVVSATLRYNLPEAFERIQLVKQRLRHRLKTIFSIVCMPCSWSSRWCSKLCRRCCEAENLRNDRKLLYPVKDGESPTGRERAAGSKIIVSSQNKEIKKPGPGPGVDADINT